MGLLPGAWDEWDSYSVWSRVAAMLACAPSNTDAARRWLCATAHDCDHMRTLAALVLLVAPLMESSVDLMDPQPLGTSPSAREKGKR